MQVHSAFCRQNISPNNVCTVSIHAVSLEFTCFPEWSENLSKLDQFSENLLSHTPLSFFLCHIQVHGARTHEVIMSIGITKPLNETKMKWRTPRVNHGYRRNDTKLCVFKKKWRNFPPILIIGLLLECYWPVVLKGNELGLILPKFFKFLPTKLKKRFGCFLLYEIGLIFFFGLQDGSGINLISQFNRNHRVENFMFHVVWLSISLKVF